MQIEEVFSAVGAVKRVIMGLNMKTKTPCGFCFVEYYATEHAAAALKFLNGTKCDDRVIRCDMDTGFKPGRQYGRGISGGQVRDERRSTYDSNRGGILPKTAGNKRSHDGVRRSGGDGKDERHRYSGANTDAFGRDLETREEALATQQMDDDQPDSRKNVRSRSFDEAEDDAEEANDADSAHVDETDPLSMEDERDAGGEGRNPTKRTRT